MKTTSVIATSLAVSALLAPSVMADDAKTKTSLVATTQIDAIMKTTPGFEGVKKVHDAFTLRESSADYNKMSYDLLNIARYTHTKGQDYEDAWRVLLVDLVDPALADKLVASVNMTLPTAAADFEQNANAILLVASTKGLNSTELAPAVVLAQAKIDTLNGTVVQPAASNDTAKAKEDPKIEQDRENYLYKFCSTLTQGNKQFLFANSTTYTAKAENRHAGENDDARLKSQDDIVLSVLDLCKAHLGDARTLAASALLSTAAAVAVVCSFI